MRVEMNSGFYLHLRIIEDTLDGLATILEILMTAIILEELSPLSESMNRKYIDSVLLQLDEAEDLTTDAELQEQIHSII